jgi:prepilin-type N-terminal cleavage/methylation domain-containing protein
MNRRGMTLVEMMVAVTATLILMGAVAQVFAVFGTAVSNSRSMLELDSRLRVAANRLRTDLKGVTARTLPPLSPETAEGYFEILEGPWAESNAADGADVARTDVDDVLLFTTRSPSAPFVGRGPSGPFESPVAEVAWFARQTVDSGSSMPVTFTLYRKQLLVLGYAGVAPFSDGANGYNATSWPDHYLSCDVSVRLESGKFRPNTLGDLTRPENRFMHRANNLVTGAGGAFPSLFVSHMWPSANNAVDVMDSSPFSGILPGLIFDGTSSRAGEDVVLTNVLSFDVRVFDPGTPVALSPSGGGALVSGDPGFSYSPIASGGYVDLGNTQVANSLLAASGTSAPFGAPVGGSLAIKTGTTGAVGAPQLRSIYDTWSTHYESDGIDQSNPASSDEQGSNGIDDDGDGQVDELDEQDGVAPYRQPLRGIEVRIRCWEPSSRQVRQVTVRHTCVPH